MTRRVFFGIVFMLTVKYAALAQSVARRLGKAEVGGFKSPRQLQERVRIFNLKVLILFFDYIDFILD